MNIAHRLKYELIQIQKECGPSLTQPNPTALKENAKPMEAASDTPRNHLSGPPLRGVGAVRNANAPTPTAISTKSREIGGKLRGPLISGETPISPNAPSARPCSESSQELPLPEFHTPAVIAHAPATSASMLISQTAFGNANLRRLSDPSGVQHQKVHDRAHRVNNAARSQQPPDLTQCSEQYASQSQRRLRTTWDRRTV